MKRNYLTRKENLVITAIEIIDRLGIQGLTIRELANCEGITEGAIYRHFKNKNEIILAVLDQFSNFDSAITAVIKEQKMRTFEGILFYTRSYAEYYENYPALTSAAFIYEFIKEEPELKERMKKIFEFRFNSIIDIIIEGQKNGEVILESSPEEFADIILGIIQEIIFRWRLNEYSFGLKEKMISTVKTALKLCHCLHTE